MLVTAMILTARGYATESRVAYVTRTSRDRAGLAQHLADLGRVRFLGGDLRTRVLLEQDVAPGDDREELAVLGEPFLLVSERLAQDLVDVVLVGLEQRADLQRGVLAEGGDVLARLYGVCLRLVRLAAQPGDDRDAVVTEDHEAVVQITHQAGELELEDALEDLDGPGGFRLAELGGSHEGLPAALSRGWGACWCIVQPRQPARGGATHERLL